MRRGSYNPNYLSCFEGSAMKRLIYLSLVLTLAACGTTAQPPENNNGGGSGNGERPLCDDGRHSLAVNAKTIEFGKAYELTSGLLYFRTETDRPTRVTLRLDNMPNYGYLGYSVLNQRQQSVITGYFSDLDGPIPSSAIFTDEIEEAGAVFVQLEHFTEDLSDTRCPKYQFTLFRE